MVRARVVLGAVALLAVAGCDDTLEPTEITLNDLVGTWVPTSFTFTPTAGGAGFDLIANGGTATLVLAANGTLTGSISFAGQSDSVNGTVTVANGLLTLTEGGDVTVFAIALNANILTLTTDDAEFDFPLDGVTGEVPARLVIIARKS